MAKKPTLREADEPVPWPQPTQTIIGFSADSALREIFGRNADFAIVRCDGCGRWQEFSPPFTFAALRQKAAAAGWRRDGDRDLCPICAGN
jgi:hypothetical protein